MQKCRPRHIKVELVQRNILDWEQNQTPYFARSVHLRCARMEPKCCTWLCSDTLSYYSLQLLFCTNCSRTTCFRWLSETQDIYWLLTLCWSQDLVCPVPWWSCVFKSARMTDACLYDFACAQCQLFTSHRRCYQNLGPAVNEWCPFIWVLP